MGNKGAEKRAKGDNSMPTGQHPRIGKFPGNKPVKKTGKVFGNWQGSRKAKQVKA